MMQSAGIPFSSSNLGGVMAPVASQAHCELHCIAVNPRGMSEMSGVWFRSAAEADGAFNRMAQSHSMREHTLERFRLLVDAGLSEARMNDLVIAAVQWEAYLPIVTRAGDRAASNDSNMAPLGAYELAWPHDADPEVGIRPRG